MAHEDPGGACAALLDRMFAEDGADAATVIAQARGKARLAALARAFPRASRPALALAFMMARAAEGNAPDALAHATFLGPLAREEDVRAFVRALERRLPAPEPGAPYVDAEGTPVVFVVSYPRSGNTRFLNIMEGAFPGSRHVVNLGGGAYVSLHARQVARKGPIFVKDHVLREVYRANPVIYLMRDGRDVYLSLNDFEFRARRKRGGADGPDDVQDSLRHIATEAVDGLYYGRWQDHVRQALAWRETGRDIRFLTYDAITADDAGEAITAALAGLPVALTAEAYRAGEARAREREDFLRATLPEWSREPLYREGTLMARWLADPAHSRWRQLLCARDRRILHEAGVTDALLAAGFETDPDWWRR